jgi:hypothetical protein
MLQGSGCIVLWLPCRHRFGLIERKASVARENSPADSGSGFSLEQLKVRRIAPRVKPQTQQKPVDHGALFPDEWQDALWNGFFTAPP